MKTRPSDDIDKAIREFAELTSRCDALSDELRKKAKRIAIRHGRRKALLLATSALILVTAGAILAAQPFAYDGCNAPKWFAVHALSFLW